MADYARKGSADRLARSHAEQIRRIRTRIPTNGLTTSYQITDADLNNDGSSGGWFLEGTPYPTFVRQGDLVVLSGCFHLFTPFAGVRGLIIAAGVVPVEFRPYRRALIFSGGLGFTDDHLWMVLLQASGQLELSGMHTDGAPFNHPDPAWGDVTVGTQHALHLNATYPARELELGEYPA